MSDEMKFRKALLTKVLLIAFGNLLVLGVAFLVLIKIELRLDVESFLVSPARDHILAVSRLLALQLGDSDPASWDALVERRAIENKVELRLLDERGVVLAGNRTPVPGEIVQKFLARRETSTSGRARGRDHHDGYDLTFLGASGQPTRHWAAVPVPIRRSGTPRREPRTWILISSSGQDGLFHVDATPWIVAGCIVIGISVAFWLPFVRGLTRAISRMTAATAQIAEGHFETQLPAGRSDELGELSSSISRMASRLDRLVNGQKRFLRDAAHEIRSPIGRIQVALGLLDRSATAEQQSLIADLHEDVQHMSSLVDDVLSFSKVGYRSAEPQLQDVQLVPIVQRVVEREGSDGAEISVSTDGSLVVRADPEMLFRALSNVVRNAVRYAGAAGPIEISGRVDEGFIAIVVTDCGPGVPEKDLDAVFEPFYRLESARERATGGVGLGLAIVRSAVEFCGGTVRCRNRQPGGLEVEIRVPSGEQSRAGTETATQELVTGQPDC